MEYIILKSHNPAELIASIEEYLDKGYKLQGGVSHTTVGTMGLLQDPMFSYAQALIKEKDEDETGRGQTHSKDAKGSS